MLFYILVFENSKILKGFTKGIFSLEYKYKVNLDSYIVSIRFVKLNL